MALDHNCTVCGRAIGYEGLCWLCRAEKERMEALSLTGEEIAGRQKYLTEHPEELGKRDDKAENYFWDCLSCHGIISPELQRAAVKAEVYLPPEIYYHAPADVRDELIGRLMTTGDGWTAGRLMTCLAMQGDSEARRCLFELQKNPKGWRKELYVDPDMYACIGGWSFDSSGNYLPVNFDKCYPIVKKNTEDRALVIGRPREDTCPHCGSRLVDILCVDGTDPRLEFLGVKGKITATCCPNCVMGEPVFSRFEPDDTSTACFPYKGLSDSEECFLSAEDYEQLEHNGMGLGEKDVPLFYDAINWDANTLGGFAFWIQDCVITRCPDCGKPMRYLAQLSWESIMSDLMEGTLYIEFCPDCRVASMQHQQT